MKTIVSLLLVFGPLLSVRSADTYETVFTPTPENAWIPAMAAFSITGPIANFVIRFGFEEVVPSAAKLAGNETNFTFDLGSAHVVIHSPGGPDGWPNGYDGATKFSGSFVMPEALRHDFVNGNATLLLPGTTSGDFHGIVVPVLGVQSAQSGVVLSWPATSTNFILQSVPSLVASNTWVTVTNSLMVIGSNNIVTGSIANGVRLYRLKRL